MRQAQTVVIMTIAVLAKRRMPRGRLKSTCIGSVEKFDGFNIISACVVMSCCTVTFLVVD
jgi:hypothetical protein